MGLSKIIRRLFRPRLHPRFYTDKRVFVVVEPYTAKERKVQMLDISEGGCAFIYHGPKEELEKIGFLSLQFKDIPYLERINFVSKSDNLLSDFNDKEDQLREEVLSLNGWVFSTGKSSKSLSNRMSLAVRNNLYRLYAFPMAILFPCSSFPLRIYAA